MSLYRYNLNFLNLELLELFLTPSSPQTPNV